MKWTLVLSALLSTAAHAAEFVPERTTRFDDWSAILYRNVDGNRLFCAIEAENGKTAFRINRYKESGETFLEIFNPDWTFMQGAARFTLDFDLGKDTYQAEFAGKSWGDSYTYDFTDVKNYEVVLGMISKAKSFSVKNANDAVIVELRGKGSDRAIDAYEGCVAG